MLPSPTHAAIVLFCGGLAGVALGIALASPAAIALGGVSLVAVAATLAASVSMGRRLRAERLEFAWWLDHGTGTAGGSAVPGVPFDVRCYVRHRGGQRLEVERLDPLVPESVRVTDAAREPFAIAARARTEFTLQLLAPAAGRVVLHGLAVAVRGPFGLFQTPLYFPNPLVIKLLPRAAAGRYRGRRALPHASSAARSGRTMVRRRGGGTELHEIRELVPGDPFKSIAWKASARRGRLMVKEVEQEVQETRWTLLDVSGTMRGGPLGGRKLDFAVEVAAAEARGATEGGDRVGLITFDSRIVSHVPPAEGKAQVLRVYDALLACTEIVDEDLTDIGDAALAEYVLRYVRQQDGLDFRRGRNVDLVGLVAHISRRITSMSGRALSEVHATASSARVLRAFCRERGLPLPHRADAGSGAKARALAEALTLAGGRSRVPTSIVVVTDFDGITDDDAFLRALKLVRAHGHRVSFVLPDGRSFADAPTRRLEEDLSVVYGRSEDRRLQRSKAMLGRLGVPAVVARRGDAPGLVAARVRGAA